MSRTHESASLRRLVALVGLMALPVGAMALEPGACVLSATGFGRLGLTDLGSDAPKGLGGGGVEQVGHAGADGEVRAHVSLDNCASGRSNRATPRWTTNQERYEASGDPSEPIQDTIRSPEAYGLGDAVEMLRSHGIRAEALSSDLENCGCAVFYPRLRSDQTPWRG